MLTYQERRTAATNKKRSIIIGAVAVISIVVVASFLVAFQQTNLNEFDDATRPGDTFHDVSVIMKDPKAGTVASMGGKVRHGETFNFKVTSVSPGYIFVGWFSDNRIVSKSQSFDYLVDHVVKLEARFLKIYDTSFIITQTGVAAPLDMTITPIHKDNIAKRTWALKDAFTGKAVSYSPAPDDGITFHIEKEMPLTITHTIFYTNGDSESKTSTIVINKDVIKTFSWRYLKNTPYSSITNLLSINGGSVTWNVEIPLSEYYYATVDPIPRNGPAGAYDVIGDFITDETRVIEHMRENLTIFSAQMSDIERVDFVLKFVQSIPYVEDMVSKGVRDYYKLPVETLWEQNGDCEDHALLYATLLKALGYKVVIFHVYIYNGSKLVGGHVAVGVAVEGASGYYEEIDGVKYYYCEATAEVGTSWLNQANVGYKPDGYKVVETWQV